MDVENVKKFQGANIFSKNNYVLPHRILPGKAVSAGATAKRIDGKETLAVATKKPDGAPFLKVHRPENIGLSF